MQTSPTRPESALLLALTMAVLLACLGPAITQHAHYHAFADQRTWLGMVLAFAGLLGWASADRVSARAGWWVAGAVMVLGPLSVGVWATTANLLPWVVLQGGGMLLLLVLAMRRPIHGAWGLPLLAVIAIYALAKVLELQDHAIFHWTQGLVSGHSLKHLVAAGVAWPLIAVVHNATQSQ